MKKKRLKLRYSCIKRELNYATMCLKSPYEGKESISLLHQCNKGSRLNIMENMNIFKLEMKGCNIYSQSEVTFQNLKVLKKKKIKE